MDFPDHVLFNVNVAVVAMVFKKKYGLDEPIIRSTEVWKITDKLNESLSECLKTEDSVLDFTNWFFDGIRKTFEPRNNLTSKSSSSFSLQYQHQLLVYPDTCFQCKNPYDSTSQDKWCGSCESFIFESNFHTWTSGSIELDRFIRQTQLASTDSTHFLRWIPFSAFTDLNEIGKGGFSEVYTGKYTKDRLDGTLKQWVTNMEHQVILNYMQSFNGDKKENIEGENWEKILLEFIKKMRNIYYEGKELKCKSRVSSEEKTEKTDRSIKRSSSFTRLKSLIRRNSSKRRNKNRSLSNLESFEPRTKVSQVPATVSPIRNKFVPKTVVLRRLVNSQNLSSSFIKELKWQYLSLRKSSKVPIMYGLTQDPQTKDYYIVEQYANDLDLHKYLIQNCASIDWWQRMSILNEIVRGIYDLHKLGLVHHNLHTGNILVRHSTRRKEAEKVNSSPSVKIWISDSGLCGPAGSTGSSNLTSDAAPTDGNSNRNSITPSQSEINLRKGIYGVLPYVAPEVLQGKEYTTSSDIYSLGIIMWELSNSATLKRKQRHRQPFHDQPYDINLAKEIVTNQKRPDIYDQTAIPECWLDLMKKCWASNPEDRPDIDTIAKSTNEWNMEKRKSLESKSSLVYSLSQSIISGSSNNNLDHEGVTAQFLEAEKKRVERLNKGKQVERDDKLNSEEKKSEENKEDGTIENVDQEDEDDDVHPEASMKSRLIDFVVQALSSNNDEDSEIIPLKEHHVKKVDSGYQQRKEEQEDESKEIRDETESEHEPEKTTEKETDSNKHTEEKQLVVNEVIEPVLVQEDKTKHVKMDENPIEVKQDNKQDNQDIPIKNGIEANSETGSKEITITKEKEP